jgi:hypothetical protein
MGSYPVSAEDAEEKREASLRGRSKLAPPPGVGCFPDYFTPRRIGEDCLAEFREADPRGHRLCDLADQLSRMGIDQCGAEYLV